MKSGALRRIACVGAMLGLGVASSPSVQAATVARVTPSTAGAVSSNHATSPVTTTYAQPRVTGRGWGLMLTCAGCAVGAIAIVVGGPAAIAGAVNMPGSALVLLGCTAACYEAFK